MGNNDGGAVLRRGETLTTHQGARSRACQAVGCFAKADDYLGGGNGSALGWWGAQRLNSDSGINCSRRSGGVCTLLRISVLMICGSTTIVDVIA
jgi:hypothetical protein